jgi:tetratricopeptide (TPR) repeat protein
MAGKIQMFCVALLAGVLLFCGCNPSRKTTEPKSAAEQKDMLLKQLNRHFEDPVTQFEVAQLYKTEGRFDDAEYHYKLALTFGPVYWPAQAGYVKTLELKRKTAEADTAAGLYMTQVATSLERSLALGDAFDKQKADKYAVACFQQALRLNPKSAVVYKHLGDFYYERIDAVRAIQYYRESLKYNWNQPEVGRQLGKLGVPVEIKERTTATNARNPKQSTNK